MMRQQAHTQGYEQIGDWSIATRGGGWVTQDDYLCEELGEKTTLQVRNDQI